MGENLQTRLVRIIHQDQRRAIVRSNVADTDVLQIAAEVGKAERLLIEHFEETEGTAAMLHVRPAGFRNGRHVETVALRYEGRFVLREAIECAMALELLPHFAAAVRRLSGPHARRRSDVEKFVAHGDIPPADGM